MVNAFAILLRGHHAHRKEQSFNGTVAQSTYRAGLGEVQTYVQSGHEIATPQLTHVEIEKQCMTLSTMTLAKLLLS